MEIKELPEGWVEAKIGTLNMYPKKNIKPVEYPKKTFELYSVPIFPDKYPELVTGNSIGSSKQIVEKDDVLICKINPRINRVWQVSSFTNNQNIASTEWVVFRQNKLNPSFYCYYFQSLTFRNLLCSNVSGVGGALTRAQPKHIATYVVPVPPLAEQQQIAKLLDNHLTQVEQIQNNLNAIPKILEKFRQSVLADAVSGKLTEDWRENNFIESINIETIVEFWKLDYEKRGMKFKTPKLSRIEDNFDIPSNWKVTQLGKVLDIYVGSTPSRKKSSYWNGDIKWVSSSEVAFCRIKDTKEKITNEGLANSSTKVHPAGTVMLAMIGQGKTRGQVAILDIDACHNQNTAALRVPKKFISSEYLYFFLTKKYEETRTIGSGNNQKALNKNRVQSLEFILPPLPEQTEIVRRVEELFAFADQIEERVQQAQSRTNHLTQSILNQAFTGKLTEQWRADNPELITGDNSAAALLASIKAEHKKTKSTKNPKINKKQNPKN